MTLEYGDGQTPLAKSTAVALTTLTTLLLQFIRHFHRLETTTTMSPSLKKRKKTTSRRKRFFWDIGDLEIHPDRPEKITRQEKNKSPRRKKSGS